MTLREALGDPALFGPHFGGESWAAWRVVLAAAFGEPLDRRQRAVFRQHARRKPPARPVRELWGVCGRRAGKSRVAGLLAVFVATFRDYRDLLAPGEKATVALIAADRAQARVCFRYICGLLDAIPLLARLVVRRTASAVELSTGVVIEVHTCSFRTTRGYSFAAVIADELAFWRDERSASPDVEVLTALRPGLATIPGSLLVAISSPYARRGALWQAYRDHFGRDGDPVLVWQADTASMNPAVDRQVIAAAYEADEIAAAAEYGAEFRRDVEALIAAEALEAVVAPGRRELPPIPGVDYQAFTDPSGGSADAFTLAIAHAEARGEQRIAVLDLVREVRPPFSPEAVVKEFATVLRSYRLATVTGDRYGGEWVREPFARHGIAYGLADHPKSELYGAFLPLVNSRRLELLDLPRGRAQLLGLERRAGRSGRDTIDHGPGAHDDVANAIAGACVRVVEEVRHEQYVVAGTYGETTDWTEGSVMPLGSGSDLASYRPAPPATVPPPEPDRDRPPGTSYFRIG